MSAALTQLAASALVGLARKPPAWPTAPGGIGEVLGGMENDEAEARFLRTAGVLALAAEAGQTPETAAESMPAAPAEESRAADTPRLRMALTNLIASGPVEILIELLALLTKKGRTLPAEFLPALLTAAANKPALRAALAGMPGKRHRWLASFNPEWKAVLTEEISGAVPHDEHLWTDGSTPERIAVLRQIRQREPARARELLAAVLPKEAAKERMEMLSVMGQGLSADDEALLNSALADKSKGQRQLAAELLSRLPESAFAQRVSARLAGIVTVQKKLLKSATLELVLPEKFDPAWAKDGIEEKPSQGEGAKAFWLRQMTELTPLPWWGDHCKMPPVEIVGLMTKSDWAQSLVSGVGAAVLTQQDGVWARAMMEHAMALKGNINFEAIVAVAGPAAAEQWLTSLVKQRHFTMALSQAIRLEHWSETFTDLMLTGARKEAANLFDNNLNTMIASVAMKLPVSRLSAAAEGWEPFFDKPYLRSGLAAFLQNIHLRKAIHEELAALSP